MNRCIYCWRPLNDASPRNDDTRSEEHIVPWALGGSNGFTTSDTSTKYNNDYGSSIDEPFADLLPLAIVRHRLRIPGVSGTIPPIRWEMRSADNNEPMKVTISADGNIDYRPAQVVINEPHATHTRRLIAGSPEQVSGMLAGMITKAKRQGQTIYHEDETLLDANNIALYQTVEETNLLHGSIKAFDFEIWTRGIAKIVLGLGHFVLGPDWTFSTSGDRIRSLLTSPPADWPGTGLKGFIAGKLNDRTAATVGITAASRADYWHTLAILPREAGEPLAAVISLFGGEHVPEAVISLGTDRGHLATVNDMLPPGRIVGVQINPATRVTRKISVEELMRNIEGMA